MLYRELADIASHLGDENLDIEGILQTFCMRKFDNARFLASFFFQIQQDGSLHLEAYFGANPIELGLAGNPISIFDDHPAAESIRSDSTICLESFVSLKSRVASAVLAWPVESEARTIGSLVTLVDSKCEDKAEVKEFVEALALILNSAIGRRVSGVVSTMDSNGKGINTLESALHARSKKPEGELTERQLVILRLISEGRTNGDIAELLGYSESLIRQETIKIYSLLSCNGRQEAAKIYRQSMQEEMSGSDDEKVRVDILTEH